MFINLKFYLLIVFVNIILFKLGEKYNKELFVFLRFEFYLLIDIVILFVNGLLFDVFWGIVLVEFFFKILVVKRVVVMVLIWVNNIKWKI